MTTHDRSSRFETGLARREGAIVAVTGQSWVLGAALEVGRPFPFMPSSSKFDADSGTGPSRLAGSDTRSAQSEARRRMLDGMLYRPYAPTSPLSDFVEDFWLYDDYTPRHLKERILPSGTVELAINLRDDELSIYDRMRLGVCERFSGAIVSGTYDRFVVIDTAEEASLLGAHFQTRRRLPLVRPAGE
jgi:hypothetical protein